MRTLAEMKITPRKGGVLRGRVFNGSHPPRRIRWDDGERGVMGLVYSRI
jgi:hypothetical protein